MRILFASFIQNQNINLMKSDFNIISYPCVITNLNVIVRNDLLYYMWLYLIGHHIVIPLHGNL